MSSALASLAVVIYTANDTAAAAVCAKGEGKGKGKVEVEVKGKGKVEVKDKDKYNNAISKSILLGRF
jgi:hypothetical protein